MPPEPQPMPEQAKALAEKLASGEFRRPGWVPNGDTLKLIAEALQEAHRQGEEAGRKDYMTPIQLKAKLEAAESRARTAADSARREALDQAKRITLAMLTCDHKFKPVPCHCYGWSTLERIVADLDEESRALADQPKAQP